MAPPSTARGEQPSRASRGIRRRGIEQTAPAPVADELLHLPPGQAGGEAEALYQLLRHASGIQPAGMQLPQHGGFRVQNPQTPVPRTGQDAVGAEGGLQQGR